MAQAAEPRGRAYLFRGIAGLIYSLGMDELAQRINRTGVQAGVDTYLMWRGVANQAIRDYRRDPQPITLIGHSMGGDAAVAFAEYLNAADIPVSLLVTYDPSRFADDVPPNVQRYINIYQSLSVMGGGNIISARGFHGHYASINLSAHGEIIHINIEKADGIQEQLVAKIVQIARTPAAGQGEAVPIRYAVPAASAIELWDSGVAVTAQAGDTLQSLATAHHVPIWALTQINADVRGSDARWRRAHRRPALSCTKGGCVLSGFQALPRASLGSEYKGSVAVAKLLPYHLNYLVTSPRLLDPFHALIG